MLPGVLPDAIKDVALSYCASAEQFFFNQVILVNDSN